MNVTNQDQVLSEGTAIGHGEPAVWAATIDDQKPEPRQNKKFPKQLREVVAGARPNLSIPSNNPNIQHYKLLYSITKPTKKNKKVINFNKTY